MKLKIEYVPLDELKTYVNNAKVHTAEQVEQIKDSIERFGMCDPIAVWKDNVIIEGHGRLIALQELGHETAPIIRLDHLSDEQRKAYGLIHNKLTMSTGFDIDLLAEELEAISEINMGEFGFDLDFDDVETEFEDDDRYTKNVNIPQYTPSDEDVTLDECVDTTKYDELLMAIEKSKLPKGEKDFLKLAAARHICFTYKKVADYYAQASEEMQELMEQSALVIIDVEDAIKYGYAKLSTYLDEIEEHDNAER